MPENQNTNFCKYTVLIPSFIIQDEELSNISIELCTETLSYLEKNNNDEYNIESKKYQYYLIKHNEDILFDGRYNIDIACPPEEDLYNPNDNDISAVYYVNNNLRSEMVYQKNNIDINYVSYYLVTGSYTPDDKGGLQIKVNDKILTVINPVISSCS